MLTRFRTLFEGWRSTTGQPDPLQRWAQQHQLTFTPVSAAHFVVSGQLDGKAFRAECGPPSRSFIQGTELRAKLEQGLRQPGAVVVMNRSLKRQLDAEASALYSDYIDDLQTSALNLPEEIRWLSRYRDMGWSGPPDTFWAAFAVLTDAPDMARQWLNAEMVGLLMHASALRGSDDVPFMLMLMRGNTYLRLQVDPVIERQTLASMLAFFARASEGAKLAHAG